MTNQAWGRANAATRRKRPPRCDATEEFKPARAVTGCASRLKSARATLRSLCSKRDRSAHLSEALSDVTRPARRCSTVWRSAVRHAACCNSESTGGWGHSYETRAYFRPARHLKWTRPASVIFLPQGELVRFTRSVQGARSTSVIRG